MPRDNQSAYYEVGGELFGGGSLLARLGGIKFPEVQIMPAVARALLSSADSSQPLLDEFVSKLDTIVRANTRFAGPYVLLQTGPLPLTAFYQTDLRGGNVAVWMTLPQRTAIHQDHGGRKSQTWTHTIRVLGLMKPRQVRSFVNNVVQNMSDDYKLPKNLEFVIPNDAQAAQNNVVLPIEFGTFAVLPEEDEDRPPVLAPTPYVHGGEQGDVAATTTDAATTTATTTTTTAPLLDVCVAAGVLPPTTENLCAALGEVRLPFRISEEERKILLHHANTILIGRSGTGKTLCAVLQLRCRMRAYELQLAALSPQLATTVPSRAHHVFVTLSPLLAKQIGRVYQRLSSGEIVNGTGSDEERYTEDDEDEPAAGQSKPDPSAGSSTSTSVRAVNSLRHAVSSDFPMIVSLSRFLELLDGTLAMPFFARDKSGNVLRDQSDHSWHFSRTASALRSPNGTTSSMPYTSYEVTYDVFVNEFWSTVRGGLDTLAADLVWQEIVSVIKGSPAALDTAEGYLSEDAYRAVNSRSSFVTDRGAVYVIFKNYERAKEFRRLYDAGDLVFHLYNRIRVEQYRGLPLHGLTLDEVQDFTPATLKLLMAVCATPDAFFMCGDTCQTITRGVAFRFADLKQLFFAQQQARLMTDLYQATMFQLTLNYRSHRNLAAVGHNIVEILNRLFPQTIDKLEPEIGVREGPKPLVLTESSTSELFSLLSSSSSSGPRVEFGAHQVVLVRREIDKENLPDSLKPALCLTILESKGLEFDDVFLYNFFNTSPCAASDWQGLPYDYARQSAGLISDPSMLLCGELKTLYVAVTRARTRLFICEEREQKPAQQQAAPTREKLSPARYILHSWLQSGLVQEATNEQVSNMAQKSDPAAWLSQGLRMLRFRFYGAAILCFEHAGDTRLARLAASRRRASAIACALAEAKLIRNATSRSVAVNRACADFATLAPDFIEVGHPAEAAKCFFSAGNPQRAAELYSSVGRHRDAAQCFSVCNQFHEAGMHSELAGDYSDALRYFTQAESYTDCLGVLRRHRAHFVAAFSAKSDGDIRVLEKTIHFASLAATKEIPNLTREPLPLAVWTRLSRIAELVLPADHFATLNSYVVLSDSDATFVHAPQDLVGVLEEFGLWELCLLVASDNRRYVTALMHRHRSDPTLLRKLGEWLPPVDCAAMLALYGDWMGEAQTLIQSECCARSSAITSLVSRGAFALARKYLLMGSSGEGNHDVANRLLLQEVFEAVSCLLQAPDTALYFRAQEAVESLRLVALDSHVQYKAAAYAWILQYVFILNNDTLGEEAPVAAAAAAAAASAADSSASNRSSPRANANAQKQDARAALDASPEETQKRDRAHAAFSGHLDAAVAADDLETQALLLYARLFPRGYLAGSVRTLPPDCKLASSYLPHMLPLWEHLLRVWSAMASALHSRLESCRELHTHHVEQTLSFFGVNASDPLLRVGPLMVAIGSALPVRLPLMYSTTSHLYGAKQWSYNICRGPLLSVVQSDAVFGIKKNEDAVHVRSAAVLQYLRSALIVQVSSVINVMSKLANISIGAASDATSRLVMMFELMGVPENMRKHHPLTWKSATDELTTLVLMQISRHMNSDSNTQHSLHVPLLLPTTSLKFSRAVSAGVFYLLKSTQYLLVAVSFASANDRIGEMLEATRPCRSSTLARSKDTDSQDVRKCKELRENLASLLIAIRLRAAGVLEVAEMLFAQKLAGGFYSEFFSNWCSNLDMFLLPHVATLLLIACGDRVALVPDSLVRASGLRHLCAETESGLRLSGVFPMSQARAVTMLNEAFLSVSNHFSTIKPISDWGLLALLTALYNNVPVQPRIVQLLHSAVEEYNCNSSLGSIFVSAYTQRSAGPWRRMFQELLGEALIPIRTSAASFPFAIPKGRTRKVEVQMSIDDFPTLAAAVAPPQSLGRSPRGGGWGPRSPRSPRGGARSPPPPPSSSGGARGGGGGGDDDDNFSVVSVEDSFSLVDGTSSIADSWDMLSVVSAADTPVPSIKSASSEMSRKARAVVVLQRFYRRMRLSRKLFAIAFVDGLESLQRKRAARIIVRAVKKSPLMARIKLNRTWTTSDRLVSRENEWTEVTTSNNSTGCGNMSIRATNLRISVLSTLHSPVLTRLQDHPTVKQFVFWALQSLAVPPLACCGSAPPVSDTEMQNLELEYNTMTRAILNELARRTKPPPKARTAEERLAAQMRRKKNAQKNDARERQKLLQKTVSRLHKKGLTGADVLALVSHRI
eukprot:gnl/Spiro4/11777_TR6220_c0_g1_i1.p1 gnl/Spiro4/11777_TR6220_c0_g1~~gnl/Spiro4/11777_TR6220_c0_g1_i1.p1  ORF type:complete len:2237 (-),score=447.40 gnl/Spiro4/11777_TR6220_c0_g1_i1:57-6767(-)